MDLLEVAPGLVMLPLGISNAYGWHDPEGVTVIDSGLQGSAPAIRAALEDLGLPREELRRIVLAHSHDDHTGSAAELATGPARRSSPEGRRGVRARAAPVPPITCTPSERHLPGRDDVRAASPRRFRPDRKPCPRVTDHTGRGAGHPGSPS